jgi:3-dehydroquinate dehydratase-2
MSTILVLHGPNLNLLGTREPDHYGTQGLSDIDRRLKDLAQAAGHSLQCFQSNAEHELIEQIHNAPATKVEWIIINPAGFTHTSVALRDALAAVRIPFIEVHLSNVHAREAFRRHSYFSDLAAGVISGFGAIGYELALQAALAKLANQTP